MTLIPSAPASCGSSSILILPTARLSAYSSPILTEQIDNYPGFENGIDGFSLAEKMQKQAERFGARSEYAEVLAWI